MALIRTDLALASGHMNSNIPRIWCYTTPDTAIVVDDSGYFDGVAALLQVGDVIYAAVDTGGTPAYGHFVVTSIVAGVVDVANLDVLGATDSD